MTRKKAAAEYTLGRDFSQADLDEVNDHPEATQEQLRAARPFAEVFPDMAAAIRRGRGPARKPTKVSTTIRFDPDIIDALKGDDPAGWQSRANDLLRKALKLPKAS
jgi:uncharacterized protein (DUF4415 family)